MLYFISYYVKPYDFLSESAHERVVAATSELNGTYRDFLRFSAAYPDFVGSEPIDSLLATPQNSVSYTPEEFKKVVAADFPGAAETLFDNRTPQFVFPLHYWETFDRRMASMHWIFHRNVKNGWVYESFDRLKDFVRMIRDTDMRIVGSSLETYRTNFAGRDFIFIPEVDWMRTSKHILTLVPYEKQPFFPTLKSTEALVKTAVEMILRDGFFTVFTEANLEMTPDEKIIIPGSFYNVKLSKRQRVLVSDVLKAFLIGDCESVAASLIKSGVTGNRISFQTLSRLCEKIYTENKNFSVAKKYGLALAALGDYDLRFPVELRMLYLCLESVEKLSEDENIWNEAADLISLYADTGVHPEAEQTDTVEQIVQRFVSVPKFEAGLRALAVGKKVSFVENPDLIPHMIEENLKKTEILNCG